MNLPRTSRLAANVVVGLAALALAVVQPLAAVCFCDVQLAMTSATCTKPVDCCCSGPAGESASDISCDSCDCESQSPPTAATALEQLDRARFEHSLLPSFGLVAVCLGLGGLSTTSASQTTQPGGPPGRRLHAHLSVWRN